MQQQISLPYKGGCRITNLYGAAAPAGVKYNTGRHEGLDLVGLGSKLIYACEGGTVVTVAYDRPGFGHFVVIKGNSGLYYFYCHLRFASTLKTGQSIATGALIGTEGATGQAHGAHLHLEIRRSRYDRSRTVDPCHVLKIEPKIGEVEKIEEYTDAKSSLEDLTQKDIIDSPEYWLKACEVVKNLDKLIIKLTNEILQ